MRMTHYESDEATFSAPAYLVASYRGIAWSVWGWETEPDADTEWSGYENRTGNVVCTMVGDDRRFVFEPEELTPLTEDDYCGGCGQTGCCHGGR